MLTARSLNFSYATKPLLGNVSLDIVPGAITVLIGPSGTGKTTLLRCLALLERPQSGAISIDEQTFDCPWPTDRRFNPPWPKLTAVFQQLFLWPHLTLRENILLPVRRRRAPNMNEELDALIETFDMRDFVNQYPNQASLGQRQRVALARAQIRILGNATASELDKFQKQAMSGDGSEDDDAFLKLFNRTGDEKWLKRARRFAAHSIDQCEAAAQQFGQYRYSLWTGDIGLAIFLWGCINGDDRIPTQDIF